MLQNIFSTKSTKATWQEFRAVLGPAKAAVDADVKAAQTAKKAEDADDKGGVRKLTAAFEQADRVRKAKSQRIQEGWAAREADIVGRLKVAHEARAAATPADQAMRQVDVDAITEEQKNFFIARADEKEQLAEEATSLKRKYESDVARQRVSNKMVKSGARKRMREAVQAKEEASTSASF